MVSHSTILDILDRARWAPSGDNSQPWSFRLENNGRLKIYLRWHQDNVYEFDRGKPVWISAGALLESIALVATTKGLRVHRVGLEDFSDKSPASITLQFEDVAGGVPDPLEKYIEMRSVHRRAYQTRNFTKEIERDLQREISGNFSLIWFSSWWEKWKFIRLNMKGTAIRLSIPETYTIHKDVIDWENEMSPSAIPSKALGLSRLGLALTKWAMKSIERVSWLTHRAGGTLLPRIELDIIPGFFCARHFALILNSEEHRQSPEIWLELGRSLQRFWLCATRHGLLLQPGLAPIVFARYAQSNVAFTQDKAALKMASVVNAELEQLVGHPAQRVLFAGRVGFPRTQDLLVKSRSVRKALVELIIHN